MSELNVIIPYCCITGKYCSYNDGFIDGYMIGISTIFILISLTGCLNVCYEICKGPNTVESDNEDNPETEVEAEETEKTEEDKKDD
jgi:hypothetical protein